MMTPTAAFEAIRDHCRAKPDSVEEYPWGETVWKVRGKVFCFGGEWGFTVKSTLDKQEALVMHPAISVAKYVGRYGWVTVQVSDEDTLDLAKELIDESYDSLVIRRVKRARIPGN